MDRRGNVLAESWTSPAPQIVSMDVSRLGKVLSLVNLHCQPFFHFNGSSARASFTDRDTELGVSC